MAPEENKTKKRKGATDSSPKPKKLKKSDDTAVANKKTAKALKSAVKPIDDVNIHAKVSRKKVQDLFSTKDAEEKSKKSKKSKAANEDEVTESKPDVKVNKPNKSKHTEEGNVAAIADGTVEESNPKAGKSKKSKTSTDESTEAPLKKTTKEKASKDEPAKVANGKKSKKASAAPRPSELEADEVSDGEGDEDDQTAALLAGFESDEDEADPKFDREPSEKDSKPTISNELQTKLREAATETSKPGVVYVGRIPHGFYEHQMKAYFSQFGQVTRLRLSRNKKTGHPKHYAFVEFASAEVAEIVAKTMDKYLLFGHILQCRVIPPVQVHADLFKGANKRFKAIPRNKIVASQLKHGAERGVWEKRVAKEEKRRGRKNKKLEEALGYTYDAPTLKSVDVVPKSILAIEAGEEPSALLADAPTESAESAADTQPQHAAQTTKARKSKKDKTGNNTAEVQAETQDVVEPPKEKKPKKEKKSKSKTKQGVDGVEADDAEAPKEKKRKAKSVDQPEDKVKKAKKAKATSA